MALYRVRTAGTGAVGAPYVNTLNFSDSGGFTAQDCVDAVGTFWDSIKNLLHTSLTLTSEPAVAQLALDGTLQGVETTTPFSHSGTSGSEPLPFATQMLVQLTTDTVVNGRILRGRIFIPALTESSNDNGRPTAAAIAAVGIAATVLAGPTNLVFLGVWSRKWTTLGQVRAASAWSEFAVLRSRRQ